MKIKFKLLLKISSGMLFVLSACAGLQQQVAVSSVDGEKVITMEASSFKFTPNNIKAYQGDSVVIRIMNISEAGHDFTIKDPQGQTIQSVDLPSKKMVEIRVSLPEPGEYSFYCDKPLHSSFGMKGQIEVLRK